MQERLTKFVFIFLTINYIWWWDYIHLSSFLDSYHQLHFSREIVGTHITQQR
jgi:hypothetical protein